MDFDISIFSKYIYLENFFLLRNSYRFRDRMAILEFESTCMFCHEKSYSSAFLIVIRTYI